MTPEVRDRIIARLKGRPRERAVPPSILAFIIWEDTGEQLTEAELDQACAAIREDGELPIGYDEGVGYWEASPAEIIQAITKFKAQIEYRERAIQGMKVYLEKTSAQYWAAGVAPVFSESNKE